jgi:cytochrome c oxidase cbb3-type subunit 3
MSDENKEYDGIRYRANDRPPMVFKILLTVLVVWGVCFMGYYLFSGWSSYAEFDAVKKAKEARLAAEKAKGGEAATPSTHQETKTADLVAEGKKEFATRCSPCHGENAKGGIGPDLTRKEFKYGKSAPEITTTISEGRPGGMPPFKNELSREKLEGLVQYVLSL